MIRCAVHECAQLATIVVVSGRGEAEETCFLTCADHASRILEDVEARALKLGTEAAGEPFAMFVRGPDLETDGIDSILVTALTGDSAEAIGRRVLASIAAARADALARRRRQGGIQ